MRHHSYENDFDLHENETACRTHFHMKGFALRFVLKQRHKKWPIDATNYHKLINSTQRWRGDSDSMAGTKGFALKPFVDISTF